MLLNKPSQMRARMMKPLAKSSGFSLEMKSKKHIKDIKLSNGHREAVLIEGDLGRIKRISFFEDKVLVIEGHNGTLRIELSSTAFSKKDITHRDIDEEMHEDV
jgi:hypothetical protein